MSVFTQRLIKAQHLLSSISSDALLIEHTRDILYLTGLEMSAGKILITQDGAILFVDGRYIEACRKNSPCEVILLSGNTFNHWFEQHLNIRSLAFDASTTSFQSYENLVKSLPQIKIKAADAPIATLRIIKDNNEIQSMRKAAQLGCKGFEWVVSQLREGITEAELAWGLEVFWHEKGAKKLAFEPIIAFGANSSMPHYRSGNTRLVKNSPVLIDIGVVWDHYHSDMTRTVFFGEVSPQIQEIYDIVSQAQRRALDIAKPGTLIRDLDQSARSYIQSKGFGDNFSHNLGHGIGLDIHESPSLRSSGVYSEKPLQSGMFITIEPGIYLPGIGGVRLEDTILITEDGHENMTAPYLNQSRVVPIR